MRRILIIAPYGFNDRMTSFIEFVSARLLARNGWVVIAIVQSDTRVSVVEIVGGITVYRCGTLWSGMYQLLKTLLFERPAILHAHNLRNNRIGIVGSILARILRIRLLCTEYGLLHDHYLTDFRDDPLNHSLHPERVMRKLRDLVGGVSRSPKHWRYLLSSYIFHWPLAHAHHLVFVSEHNLPIVQALQLPPATYLPQIADGYRWRETKTDIPDASEKEIELKIATLNGTNVLFIGQMKLRKGWDVLLRSIPYTNPTDIARFVIVSASATSEREEFSTIVESLGIRSRVLFLGKVPNNTLLRKIYGACAIVAVPSRYEGFGLVPLEAFELGRPVVASNVVALNEYLVDSRNAILVPPEDPRALGEALTRVARDSTLREQIIRGGKKTLDQLRSKEYTDRWLSFYESQLL